ncbi:MAG: hypothetical protein ABUL44_04855, partial [Flavobacterium sp.]
KLSQRIVKYLRTQGINSGGNAIDRTGKIIEAYILHLGNMREEINPPLSWATIYYSTPIDSPINQGLIHQLTEGGIRRTGKQVFRRREEAVNAVKEVMRMIDDMIAHPPTDSVPVRLVKGEIYQTQSKEYHRGDVIHYRDFQIPIDRRLARLISIGGLQAATRIALRYSIFLSWGQQIGLVQSHYDILYDQFNVRTEWFASPWNSRLLGKPDACFNSLFSDTDGVVGSLGNVFKYDMQQRSNNFCAAPPCTNELLLMSSQKIIEEMSKFAEKDEMRLIFILYPDWSPPKGKLLEHDRL